MEETKSFVFTFDDIQVREREFSMIRSGQVLAVEPKAFRVLLFLLRHPHRLVKKDELLDAVWNDCAVSENSLTRSIALLRRLLGDDIRNPRYIATVPTAGYRFLCDVGVTEDAEAAVSLKEHASEPQFALQGANVAIAVGAQTRKSTDSALAWAAFHPRKLASWWWIVASLAVLIAAGLLYQRAIGRHGDHGALPSARMRIIPLTKLPGAVRDPAFSPDGEKVAFVWDGENPIRGDLYVQLVGAERPLRLTHTSSGFTCCADWSRNGREIIFGRCDDQGGAVYSVPAMGGTERRLTTVACHFGYAGYPKWSADGKSILLIDRCTPTGADSVMSFSLVTGEKQCLSAAPAFSLPGDSFPTLSPDGRTIAFLRRTSTFASEVYTMPAFGGNPRRITHEGLNGVNFMWSADGRRLLCYSSRRGLPRVWQIDPESGTIKPETVYPGTGTLSHDGKRLAYTYTADFGTRSSTLSQLSLAKAGGHVVSEHSVLPGDPGIFAPQPAPDGGKLVFESCRTGTCEIWSQAEGNDPLQMTNFEGTGPGTPRWSPDGRWIAFDHILGTHTQVYLVDSEGRNVHPVTSGNYLNIVPSWSLDGKAIFFASNRTRTWEVWRKELATGQEKQVTQHGGFAAFESFDGTMIYYSKFDSGGLWSVPAGGGTEHQVTDALHIGYWGYFAVTEQGIYLLDADAVPKPTVLFYDFPTRSLKPVLTLTLDPLPWSANLAASRDGRTLYLIQGKQRNSLIMAENLQPEAW